MVHAPGRDHDHDDDHDDEDQLDHATFEAWEQTILVHTIHSFDCVAQWSRAPSSRVRTTELITKQTVKINTLSTY